MPNKPRAWWAIYNAITNEVSSQDAAIELADKLYSHLVQAGCFKVSWTRRPG